MGFEMETAGSLPLTPELFQLAENTGCLHFNVSPKLSNSRNKKKWAVSEEFMRDIYVLGEGGSLWPMLKFVVNNPRDFIEIGQFCAHYNIPRHAVYIMSEGVTPESQLSNMEWLLTHCIANHYNYSPRLHTLAWGNERGV